MAKKKVYAVKQGKKLGIFYSWEECKASVDGYPGAEFKGFLTVQEARQYLGNIPGAVGGAEAVVWSGSAEENTEDSGQERSALQNQNPDDIFESRKYAGNGAALDEMTENARKQKKFSGERHEWEIPEGCVTAYVDGSFSEETGHYSFGCVLLLPGGKILRKSGNGSNPESLAIRNVAGEMLGAMYAVKWARKNEYRSIEICYDYMGIEKWAAGMWRANNRLTKKYAEYMQRQACGIEIKFRKVAAHTGNFYNEEADKLAKAALTEADGIPDIIKE